MKEKSLWANKFDKLNLVENELKGLYYDIYNFNFLKYLFVVDDPKNDKKKEFLEEFLTKSSTSSKPSHLNFMSITTILTILCPLLFSAIAAIYIFLNKTKS